MTPPDRDDRDPRGAEAGWVLRPATPDDAESLTLLHLDVWDDAYAGLMPASVLRARREEVPAQVERRRAALAAEVDDHGRARTPTLLAQVQVDGAARLIGFAVAGEPRLAEPPAPTELMALYVRAAWWGAGVGRSLLTGAVADAPAYLWVLGGNHRALRFYHRHGFELDGVEEATVHGPHLRMVRA